MQAKKDGPFRSVHELALSLGIAETSYFSDWAEYSYWAIRASLLE